MKKGKLIVLEGACDGVGKTTQFKLLEKALKKEGYSIFTHHFPSYGTYQCMAVEKYLRGEYGFPNELSPYFVNSLYAHDRGVTWYTELKKSYEKGDIILLDRYTTSSLIYQSALIENLEEKKRFIDYVIDFEYHKIGIKEPDQVLFLHAPFELITNMRREREQQEGVVSDIHESNLEFMKKVYNNALFVANYLGWDQIQCNQGSQMKKIEDIQIEIWKRISQAI